MRLHPELQAAFIVSQIAGLDAFLPVIVGGLPLLGTVHAHAIRARRWDVLIALTVPRRAAVFHAMYALLASAAWT